MLVPNPCFKETQKEAQPNTVWSITLCVYVYVTFSAGLVAWLWFGEYINNWFSYSWLGLTDHWRRLLDESWNIFKQFKHLSVSYDKYLLRLFRTVVNCCCSRQQQFTKKKCISCSFWTIKNMWLNLGLTATQANQSKWKPNQTSK